MTVGELRNALAGIEDYIPVVVEVPIGDDVCRRHEIEEASMLIRPHIKRMFVILPEQKFTNE